MNNEHLIKGIPLEIYVVLGRTKMRIKDITNLGYGSIVDFDSLEDEEVEIIANGKKIAYGEIVVIDNNYGVRITRLINQ